VACAVAVPASAQPADTGPRPVAHVERATPTAPAGDDGTPAYVYPLIGCGAALSLGAGGFMARGRSRATRARGRADEGMTMSATASSLDGVKGCQQRMRASGDDAAVATGIHPIVDEVGSGGWGIGGRALTTEDIKAMAAAAAA
jgi:hypothetical protein